MKTSTFSLGAKIAALVAGGCLVGCVHEVDMPVGYTTHTVETHRPGYVVRTLPAHEVAVVGGTRYHRHGDVYYRPHAGGYVVVDPPRTRTVIREGTVVRNLPSGYRTLTRQGTPYYMHDGVYYRRSGSGFIVVPGF